VGGRVGDGLEDRVGEGEIVGAAVTGGVGVCVTVAAGAHALATMRATRNNLIELP
jgi:hypothetical protein